MTEKEDNETHAFAILIFVSVVVIALLVTWGSGQYAASAMLLFGLILGNAWHSLETEYEKNKESDKS